MKMKLNKINLFFVLTLVITLILGYLEVSSGRKRFDTQLMIISGSILLLLFFWNFLIAARFKFFRSSALALDKLYLKHRAFGIAIVLIAISHNLMGDEGRSQAAQMGTIGFVILLIFIGATVVFNYLVVNKIYGSYEVWKLLHRFIVVPYLILSFHFYLISSWLSFAPFKIWLFIITTLGIICAIYSSFLYELIVFGKKTKVKEVNKVANDIVEIKLEQNIGNDYIPGQFGYFKFFSDGLKKEVHPFSVTSFKNGNISFSPKALGDFTSQMVQKIKVGDAIAFDGPFGNFDYNKGKEKQLWIAGGIGITPFVSFIRNEISTDKQIDFYYSYYGEDKAAYKDLFENYKSDNFAFHPHDSVKDGYLNFDKILLEDKNIEEYSIYICGPPALRKAILKIIHDNNLHQCDIHYDIFSY